MTRRMTFERFIRAFNFKVTDENFAKLYTEYVQYIYNFPKGNRCDIGHRRRMSREKVRKLISHRGADICPYCGKPVEPKDRSFDHIVAKRNGGMRDLDNLTVCHKECNKEKRTRDLLWHVVLRNVGTEARR